MQKSLAVAVRDGQEAHVVACDVKSDGGTLAITANYFL